MPRKKEYVVRVVIPTLDNSPPLAQQIDSGLLDCLRYAGLVSVHKDNEEGQCFDIHCPRSWQNDSYKWAEMNSHRMASFGYNAVVAPAYN